MTKSWYALYTIIGRNIRAAREAAGMTQAELAERTGFLRTSITNLENGRQHTPLDVLVTIADAMGVATGSLLPASLWPNSEAAKTAVAEQRLADVKIMLQEIIEEL